MPGKDLSIMRGAAANPSMRMAPLALFLLAVGCEGHSASPPPSSAPPAPAGARATATAPAPPYDIKFETIEMIIKDRKFAVEIADTDAKIQRGLMYRDRMEADHGMLFTMPFLGEHSFWMKNTLIPLDIIYLDEKGKVLEIHDRRPLDETGMASAQPALFVLELNAGRSKAIGLKVGDVIAMPEKYLKARPVSPDK